MHGDMPPDEQREAGVEAIMLARRALEISKQLYGTASSNIANVMSLLSDVLDYFNDVDDDEVRRLNEQSKAIYARVQGSLSVNVAANEDNLGLMYKRRAERALAANDLDRYMDNLMLALPRRREAVRIYRAIHHVDDADRVERAAVSVEERLRQTAAVRAATTRG